jgi:galactan endo-1,6-beta-galactosidase
MRTIRVDRTAEQGVFEGWGTSLAWWANAVGRWPRHERDAIVRRLFSLENGGLGLTVARFNAGGGENPGVESTMDPRAVMDGYRRTPQADFDEAADPGQRAVLRSAARIAAEEGSDLVVEVFGNSPPWWATISDSVTGDSTADGWPSPNLDPVFSRDYLRYLGEVTAFVERDAGVRVRSLSPFNEPTALWWVLGGRQEGCHFTREGIDRLLTELSRMTDIVGGRAIAASEEWSLDQAVASWDYLGASARRAIGRLNTHTYYGESRAAVRARAARAGIGLWVSEYGEGSSAGHDLALAIVRDLRELVPTAWVLWQAVSADNWGVLRMSRDKREVGPTAKFAVLAQFTRSIRPGMRLVGSDDPRSIAAVGSDRMAVVVVGDDEFDDRVRLELGGPVGGDLHLTMVDARGELVADSRTVDAEAGVVSFRLPAGCVASVNATVGDDFEPVGLRGSGTWWLEHESGVRLGLAASGAAELDAGVRAQGVPRDDDALAQRWRAEACGDGSARWVCTASGNQLDIERASMRPGAHAIQWSAGLAEKAPAHNRFEVAELDDGAVTLIAQHSGLALALDERGLGVQRSAGKPGTRWRLERVRG